MEGALAFLAEHCRPCIRLKLSSSNFHSHHVPLLVLHGWRVMCPKSISQGHRARVLSLRTTPWKFEQRGRKDNSKFKAMSKSSEHWTDAGPWLERCRTVCQRGEATSFLACGAFSRHVLKLLLFNLLHTVNLTVFVLDSVLHLFKDGFYQVRPAQQCNCYDWRPGTASFSPQVTNQITCGNLSQKVA